MIRKLILTLLVAAICLVGVTSALAQHAQPYNLDEYEQISGKTLTFSEAPMLRTMVAAGELPPLAERLPQDPLVIKPAEEIGQYGGTLRILNPGPAKSNMYTTFGAYEFMVAYTSDMTKLFPNVLKGWESSADAKTFTLYLRKGMRWSDGVPFTTDDLLFYWEDITQNKELFPVPPSWMMSGGEPGVMTKIDDYTVEVSFKESYGIFIESFARWRPSPYCPKHYLKQFHPKYTAEDVLNKTVKDEGFDTWPALFTAKNGDYNAWRLPERPAIKPYIAQNSWSEPIQILTRNPYYWKVDTEGNQLPYIDRIERIMVPDKEAQLLKVLAGDIDIHTMANYALETKPIVIDAQEEAGYRLVPYWWMPNSMGDVQFNMGHKDPVLRKIFNDKNFRIALSVAIDREEVNELIYQGLAEISNPTLASGPPFYGEKLFKNHLQYDPGLANQLLDEMGLSSRDAEGYRLRSDGERLRFQYIIPNWYPEEIEIGELYKGYWKEVGVQVSIKPIAGSVVVPIKLSGDWDVSMIAHAFGGRPVNPLTYADFVPISPAWSFGSPEWTRWIVTGGGEGVEPPEALKRVEEIRKQALAEPDVQKRIEAVLEIAKIYEENFWTFGGLNQPVGAKYRIVNNALRNIPDPHCGELTHSIPAQLFLKR